jgi:hypothetical protein
MPVAHLISRARRAARMPPRVLARRLRDELRTEAERLRAPRRARRLDLPALLRSTSAPSLDELWRRLGERPFPAVRRVEGAAAVAELCPEEPERVVELAERALERRVDLLGSGPVRLGRPVDWSLDFKTGARWAPAYAPRLDYAQLGRESDVKVPWELSRLQWLLPAGQAYLLTGDERYAACVRELLEEWIETNPYAGTVNWAVTMEVALRILGWTWLFHACHRSEAWADRGFRSRFLRALYLHGDYITRHLERSEVNGNHYTANAAALVFAGLFFDAGAAPARWARDGWAILVDELPRQVTPDGVDFEAASAYHRLVLELFLLPALYRRALALELPAAYVERLAAMARFAAAYTRPDGTSPLWGDADDARALPLGGQPRADHRYLAGLVGAAFARPELAALHGGARSEAAWLLGAEAAGRLPERPAEPGSQPFREGGVYILRGGGDHVFLDCGPVGLAGRGGHGHNDCLSFEAALGGVHLVTDCGSFVYTASPEWRNRFRSTAFHNTPQVDGEEQNRLGDSLWTLRNDARPELRRWQPGTAHDLVECAHTGYTRLRSPVVPVRTIVLDRSAHALAVADRFEGEGEHELAVPLHLALGVEAVELAPGRWLLEADGRRFSLRFGEEGDWDARTEPGWVSPSYGRKLAIVRLVLRRRGSLRPLVVAIAPEGALPDPLAWAREATGG